MKTSGNTILITGGSTGIGLALAKSFLMQDNNILICGRREELLAEAKKQNPSLHTKVCDVADDAQRKELFEWIKSDFKDLNILVNNAGIQREIDFTKDTDIGAAVSEEIRINFEGPVIMSALFIPLLLGKENCAIINVTSGLGFIPMARAPVYSATKAALHSFSITLRHQLSKTGIKVFEVIPPIVDTDLDKGARKARGYTDFGIKPEVVAEETINGMLKDEFEIAVGMAKNFVNSSKTDPEGAFLRMNNR